MTAWLYAAKIKEHQLHGYMSCKGAYPGLDLEPMMPFEFLPAI
jgi:hypothetical protein